MNLASLPLIGRLFAPEKMRIEPLHAAHAAAAAAMHQASFARGWDASEIARMLSGQAVVGDGLFIDAERSPVAFIVSRTAADEAEILTVCVDASRRGRGYSRALLDRHLDALRHRGVGHVFLEVEAGNEPAERLYKGRGFLQVGERPGYYAKPDGARALARVMRLDLN